MSSVLGHLSSIVAVVWIELPVDDRLRLPSNRLSCPPNWGSRAVEHWVVRIALILLVKIGDRIGVVVMSHERELRHLVEHRLPLPPVIPKALGEVDVAALEARLSCFDPHLLDLLAASTDHDHPGMHEGLPAHLLEDRRQELRVGGLLDRCVKKVKAQGGAKNAWAVCKSSMKHG